MWSHVKPSQPNSGHLKAIALAPNLIFFFFLLLLLKANWNYLRPSVGLIDVIGVCWSHQYHQYYRHYHQGWGSAVKHWRAFHIGSNHMTMPIVFHFFCSHNSFWFGSEKHNPLPYVWNARVKSKSRVAMMLLSAYSWLIWISSHSVDGLAINAMDSKSLLGLNRCLVVSITPLSAVASRELSPELSRS